MRQVCPWGRVRLGLTPLNCLCKKTLEEEARMKTLEAIQDPPILDQNQAANDAWLALAALLTPCRLCSTKSPTIEHFYNSRYKNLRVIQKQYNLRR